MTETTFRSALMTGLWVCAMAPAFAQTATVAVTAAPTVANSGASPTRMQRCQSEIADLQGATRKRALRECLVGRAEGERLIGRDCSRQYRNLPAGQTTTDKATYIKQCSAQSLNVGHKDLPKSKPAAPASGASSDLTSVNASTKTAATDKSGDKSVAKPLAKPKPAASKAS